MGKGLVTRGGRAHDGHEFADADVLVYKAVDAGGFCLLDKSNFGHTRHDDHAHRGVRLLDAPGGHDAVGAVLGADVHEHESASESGCALRGLSGVCEASCDVHVFLDVYRAGQALA